MKVFQSTVSFLTQQSFKLSISTANAEFLVPAVMNNTRYLDSFWPQAVSPPLAHFPLRLIHARDFAPGACSGSKAPLCVPTISWVHFILGSRISTPQNAPRYLTG